ncbi:unnamed protein product [Mesocestoides corti]|uniref:Uncharacterized protein n=1 Tax=Mesocestoides corti TaxID=53468 RepID=A0A0R3UNU7_MESCO|nr:unnamed protein product [Mesocestoides corti]
MWKCLECRHPICLPFKLTVVMGTARDPNSGNCFGPAEVLGKVLIDSQLLLVRAELLAFRKSNDSTQMRQEFPGSVSKDFWSRVMQRLNAVTSQPLIETGFGPKFLLIGVRGAAPRVCQSRLRLVSSRLSLPPPPPAPPNM